MADLDGDNASEIVIGALLNNQLQVVDAFGGTLAGWPQTLGGAIKAAAAVADLDGNGDLEIIVGASDGKLYAFHHTGQAVAGWPVTLDSNFRVLATPAVAHLDGDSSLDIVVPLSNGKLYALNADGSLKGGWPVSIGGVEDKFASQEANSSPRIADVDGDGSPDIVVGSTDKKLYVLSANGGLKWSFPTGDMILGAPAVADIDTGRAGLEIAFGSGDSYVYLLDKSGAQIWKKRTGWTIRSSAAAADIDGNGDLEVLVSGDDDRLWAWHHSGGAVSGWPKQATADLYSSPVVGDVDGNGDLEVLVGSDDARVYGWSGAGDPVTGWPQSTGVSVKGTPALANLDDDPALEVVVGDFGGTLYIWGFSGTLPNGGSGSELTPGISRTLRFTDTARVIDVTVPGDAITEPVRLQYRPALTRTAPASSTLAGLHFHLEAFRGSSRLDGFQFQRAISLTLTYTDADVAGLDEANLQLYFWNETSQSWQNAACGAIVRRPDINQLVVPVCHLTEFGLFEVQPQSGGFTVFLPVVMR